MRNPKGRGRKKDSGTLQVLSAMGQQLLPSSLKGQGHTSLPLGPHSPNATHIQLLGTHCIPFSSYCNSRREGPRLSC